MTKLCVFCTPNGEPETLYCPLNEDKRKTKNKKHSVNKMSGCVTNHDSAQKEGLYYWRHTKRHDLKPEIIPACNNIIRNMNSDEIKEIITNPQVTPHILKNSS